MERRAQGLCLNCGEKFYASPRCRRSILMDVWETEEKVKVPWSLEGEFYQEVVAQKTMT